MQNKASPIFLFSLEQIGQATCACWSKSRISHCAQLSCKCHEPRGTKETFEHRMRIQDESFVVAVVCANWHPFCSTRLAFELASLIEVNRLAWSSCLLCHVHSSLCHCKCSSTFLERDPRRSVCKWRIETVRLNDKSTSSPRSRLFPCSAQRKPVSFWNRALIISSN